MSYVSQVFCICKLHFRNKLSNQKTIIECNYALFIYDVHGHNYVCIGDCKVEEKSAPSNE